MKLILVYNWDVPFEASGTETFAFEYESVIAFQCFVLDEIKKAKKKNKLFPTIKVLTWEFYGEDLDSLENNIEHTVFTLEEWFEKHKKEVTLSD